MVERRRLGVTKNSAPASMQARAVSGSSTVPAPSTILPPNLSATFSSAWMAPGTVMVISAARMPPAYMASTARMALSALDVRTIGTIPTSVIKARISFDVITFHVIMWLDTSAKSGTGKTTAARVGGGGFPQPGGPVAALPGIPRKVRGTRDAPDHRGGQWLQRRQRAPRHRFPASAVYPAAQELRTDQGNEHRVASGRRGIRFLPSRRYRGGAGGDNPARRDAGCQPQCRRGLPAAGG